MGISFPESYDELAVLAHHGATGDELDRRLAEREQMGLETRWHVDLAARGHYGPTLADHRARWAAAGEHGREPAGTPAADLDGQDDPDGRTGDEDGDPEGVPDGTAADILDWAGTSPARARAAITAEKKKDSPRTSLIARLRRYADA